jgi:hypothetical protein
MLGHDPRLRLLGVAVAGVRRLGLRGAGAGATLCIAVDIDLEDGRMKEENSPLFSVT